jgi:peptidoglycan DL-endopeptidase CwlO
MRRNWLAGAALAAVAISVPVGTITGTAQAATLGNLGGQQKASATTATKVHKLTHKGPKHEGKTPKRALKRHHGAKHRRPYAGRHRSPETFDQVAASMARTLVGDPYAYGGTSPAGFDCSGLTQYVYRHTGHGKHIQRTAEGQFLQLRQISQRSAQPGDLVFFHETSDPGSYVYHVGIYEGGDDMVAATVYGEGVQLQSFAWAGDTVTFGTLMSPPGG